MKISYKEFVSRFVHGKVTDKDIIRAVDYNRCLGNIDIAINCMELARADERAKLSEEAVKVWISFDAKPLNYCRMYSIEPYELEVGNAYGCRGGSISDISYGFARMLNVQRGECKAFEIREVSRDCNR